MQRPLLGLVVLASWLADVAAAELVASHACRGDGSSPKAEFHSTEVKGCLLQTASAMRNSESDLASSGNGEQKPSGRSRSKAEAGPSAPESVGTMEAHKNEAFHRPKRSRERTGAAPEVRVLAFCGIAFIASLTCLCWVLVGAKHMGADQETEVEHKPNEAFDEDTYGLAIAMVLRDSAAMASAEGRASLRLTRISLVLLLLFIAISLQAFLLLQVKLFVTKRAVEHIREAYSRYEWEMYGKNITHLDKTAHHLFVGNPEYFDAKKFETITPGVQREACLVAFSQPVFFICILFIWTLTCVAELRNAVDLFVNLVWTSPRVDHLHEMIKNKDEDDEATLHRASTSPNLTTGNDAAQKGNASKSSEGVVKLVVGLTLKMKLFISLVILVPRIGITCWLLWLGCRWLAATNDFADLIMNSVALEFILLLKDLMYTATVPSRNKRDLASVEIEACPAEELAGCRVFTQPFLWGLAALAWACFYTYRIQYVLPGYNWDIRDVCSHWLEFGHN